MRGLLWALLHMILVAGAIVLTWALVPAPVRTPEMFPAWLLTAGLLGAALLALEWLFERSLK